MLLKFPHEFNMVVFGDSPYPTNGQKRRSPMENRSIAAAQNNPCPSRPARGARITIGIIAAINVGITARQHRNMSNELSPKQYPGKQPNFHWLLTKPFARVPIKYKSVITRRHSH